MKTVMLLPLFIKFKLKNVTYTSTSYKEHTQDFDAVIHVLFTSFSISRILWALEKIKNFFKDLWQSTVPMPLLIQKTVKVMQAYLWRYPAHFTVSLYFKTPTAKFKI